MYLPLPTGRQVVTLAPQRFAPVYRAKQTFQCDDAIEKCYNVLLVGQTAAVFLCSLTAAQYNIGMNAIILSIGSELITGQVTDTNSGYLSRRLEGLGIGTIAHWTIGDDQPAIARTIRQATDEANVVLVTGGLGPTADDLTRHGLADAMGCELRLDQQCLKAIEQRFASRGLEMPATNRRQGLIPAGAQAM